ncbi:MAG: M43 family zinc metalloprotease [Bacteroidia bacterium]|nr:M43 family zinc metalloprotease [Bacteroidia bacterium]
MTGVLLIGVLWAQISWCGTDRYSRKVVPDQGLSIENPPRLGLFGCTPSRYVIPVVFHVIHSGSSDSIDYNRIWNQMLRLHEDFRRIPETPGFSSAGADMEIEFSLATKDPNGNPTTGVVYWRYDQPPLNWSSPDFCADDEDYSMKLATGWDRNRYLNVWVVPRICFRGWTSSDCDACDLVAGYAFYPFFVNIEYGSVVGASYFWGGHPLRGARTLVHELGHNLNLPHPFEGGCDQGPCTTHGDGVCDTPPTAVVDGNFQVARQNTCNQDSPDLPDNMRNYMDYVSDRNMTHFTLGQRERAWSAIQATSSALFPLAQSSVLWQTGTGPYGHVKAYFAASHRVGCPGEPIRFFSYSMGMPHIYRWDFGGGVPDDPSSPCPTVVFPSPGLYDVRLIVENLSGRRDTLLKAGYIQIQDTVYPLPYAESFEGNVFPPQHSYIRNLDAGRTWERSRSLSTPRGAYAASPTSMRLTFFTYSSYNEVDDWISPAIDLRPYANPSIQLRFSWAYACLNFEGQVNGYTSYELDYTDTLRVYVSTDCGHTWDLLWERGGRDLSTHPDGCITARGSVSGTSYFIPSASQWKTDSLLLNPYRGEVIRLRFQGISGWGNTLYIDDIVLDTLSGISASMGAFPSINRAYISEAKLYFSTQAALPHMAIRAYDIQGREVWRESLNDIARGEYRVPLPSFLSQGLYLVRLEAEGEVHSIRYWHAP